MESSPRKIFNNSTETVKKHLYATTVNELTPHFQRGGFGEVGARVLEAAHIIPQYTLAEKNPDLFRDSRLRLQTEAGLIIANHPGHYDTYLILNALQRTDVKIVVSEENYSILSDKMGTESFIKATKDPREALSFLQNVQAHIAEGGVVLLYPTGGGDKVGELLFEPGFAALLKRCLQPSDMIYTFYIDPQSHSDATRDAARAIGAASAIITKDFIDPNTHKEHHVITVNEKYTTSAAWQTVINQSTREGRDANLTQFFRQETSLN